MKNKSASPEFSFVPRFAARSRTALETTGGEGTPDVSGCAAGTQFANVTNSLNQYSEIAFRRNDSDPRVLKNFFLLL